MRTLRKLAAQAKDLDDLARQTRRAAAELAAANVINSAMQSRAARDLREFSETSRSTNAMLDALDRLDNLNDKTNRLRDDIRTIKNENAQWSRELSKAKSKVDRALGHSSSGNELLIGGALIGVPALAYGGYRYFKSRAKKKALS
jgi:uncharacterized phage infection (PIP) family protein YhgE